MSADVLCRRVRPSHHWKSATSGQHFSIGQMLVEIFFGRTVPSSGTSWVRPLRHWKRSPRSELSVGGGVLWDDGAPFLGPLGWQLTAVLDCSLAALSFDGVARDPRLISPPPNELTRNNVPGSLLVDDEFVVADALRY